METNKTTKRSSLLNKAGKSNEIRPEETFKSSNIYTSSPMAKKSEDKSTGIRIKVSTLNKLKALKSVEKNSSISETIDDMFYSYQKNLSQEKKKELEFAIKLFDKY